MFLECRIWPRAAHRSQATRSRHHTELLLMHRFIHGTIDSDLLDAAVGIDLSFPVLFMQL